MLKSIPMLFQFKEKNFGLIFKNINGTLFGFSDADWGHCPNYRKS